MSRNDELPTRRLHLIARCEHQRAMLRHDAAPLLHGVEVIDGWYYQIKRYRRVIAAAATVATILIARRPRNRRDWLQGLKFAAPMIIPRVVNYLRARQAAAPPSVTGALPPPD
jgi:hypothetical protein